MALADAWLSEDVVIWHGLTPYRFITEVCPDATITISLNLFEMEVCYGSVECYNNIQ